MEMKTLNGICKYCGEIQPIMAADQIDADEKISEACECGGADLDKKRKAMLNNIEALCGNVAATSGMTPLDNEQRQVVEYIGTAVLEEVITSASIKLNNTTLTFNVAQDKLKITRTKNIKFSREG